MWYMPKDYYTDDEIESEDELDLGDLNSWLPEHESDSGVIGIGDETDAVNEAVGSGASVIGSGSEWSIGDELPPNTTSQTNEWIERARDLSGSELVLRAKADENNLKPYISYIKSGHSSRNARNVYSSRYITDTNTLISNMAQRVINTIKAMFARSHRRQFYFSMRLHFEDGNWRTITYPGGVDFLEYSTRLEYLSLRIEELLHYFLNSLRAKYNDEIRGRFIGYVIGVHNPPEDIGGCDKSRGIGHISSLEFKNPDGETWSVQKRCVYSTNNNCAIANILYFYKAVCSKSAVLVNPPMPTRVDTKKKGGVVRKLTAAAIKKKYLPYLNKKDMIKKKGIDILAEKLNFNITVRDERYKELWVSNAECERKLVLILEDNHYFIVLDAPKPGLHHRKSRNCDVCNAKRIDSFHICPAVQDMYNKDKKKYDSEISFPNDITLEDNIKRIMKMESHWLIHGPGGTGKSYMVREIARCFRERGFNRFAVLATTGVAALNINGMTLNSFFMCGAFRGKPEEIFNKTLAKRDIANKARLAFISKIDFIMIEECSMLTCKLFIYMSEFLRRVRRVDKPFGGVKIILIGDFMQLPPVCNQGMNNKYRYIFETKLWQKMQREPGGLKIMSLTEGHRYTDIMWSRMLNRIRMNIPSPVDRLQLRERLMSKSCIEAQIQVKKLKPTYVFGRCSRVHAFNSEKNACLNTPEQTFPLREAIPKGASDGAIMPIIESQFRIRKFLSYFDPQELVTFKIGSEVMCTTNHYMDVGIGNGSRGTVVSFTNNRSISIKFEGLEHPVTIIPVNHFEGQFSYIPLNLAWAITAHKSQGKTLSCVVTEFIPTQIFECSQAYVILSRCKKLEHIFFLKYDERCFKVNARARRFSEWCMKRKSDAIWKEQKPFLSDSVFSDIITMRDTTTTALQHQPKRGDRTLWRENTFFYDFETFFDGKHETPYYCYIIHKEAGKPDYEKQLCYLCDKVDVQQRTFDILMERLEKQCDEYINDINSCNKSRVKPMYVAAYNGSNFDYQFILNSMLKSKKWSERFYPVTTFQNSTLAFFTVRDRLCNRICLFTHDLYRILPQNSLSNAASAFLATNQKKDIFPHGAVTRELLEYASKHDTIELSVDDFPLRMREDAQKMDLKNFAFHKHLHYYGKNDVDIMILLYDAIDKLCHNIVETSVMRFSSLCRLTWYGFKNSLRAPYLKPLPSSVNDVNKNNRKKNNAGRSRRFFKIYRMTREEDDFTSKAIYGAKCFPRIKTWTSSDENNAYIRITDYKVLFDIKSMYIGVMMEKDYPYGLHQFYDSDSDEVIALNHKLKQPASEWDPALERNLFFIALCDLQMHPKEVEPPVARHGVSTRKKFRPPLMWDNVRRIGVYDSVDIYNVLRNGGKVFSIERVCIWPKRGKIFEKWSTRTFKGKEENDDDQPVRTFYKLLGNACYGSSLKKNYDDVVVHVRTPKELADFHRHYEWTDVMNADEHLSGKHSMLILLGEEEVDREVDIASEPRFLGGFTLSYSKLLSDDIYQVINPQRRSGTFESITKQVMYGDTDSFIVDQQCVPALTRAGYIGKEAGQIGDDLYKGWYDKNGNHKFAKIIAVECPAPKCYGVRAILPECAREKILERGVKLFDGKYSFGGRVYELTPDRIILDVVKIKGIPKQEKSYTFRGVKYSNLTFPIFKAIVNSNEEVIVEMPDRILRNGYRRSRGQISNGEEVYAIRRSTMFRTILKTPFTRRTMLKNAPHLSVPLGYDKKTLAKLESRQYGKRQYEENDKNLSPKKKMKKSR